MVLYYHLCLLFQRLWVRDSVHSFNKKIVDEFTVFSESHLGKIPLLLGFEGWIIDLVVRIEVYF